MSMDVKASAWRLFQRLKEKGLRYWLSALIVFVLTISGSTLVYRDLGLEEARAGYFQFLSDLGWRRAQPKFVSLIFIEDDEYWNGDLAGRAPLDRRYLARVVDKIVKSNARVIALDFDARLPNPTDAKIPDAYKEETCTLIRAIKAGAKVGKNFVLATPIWFGRQGRFRQDTDIYQSNGLCERPHHAVSSDRPCGVTFEPQEKERITCGYIALPSDVLAVPLTVDMDDGGELDSFALAIARAENSALVGYLLSRHGSKSPYGNFISEKKFEEYHARFSTTDLLKNEAINVRTGTVIVGAHWNTFAVGREPTIDLHRTPIGRLVGALLHANFAETLLDDRAVGTLPDWVLRGTEIVFGVIAALIFALVFGAWRKVGMMLSLFILLFFLQWFMLAVFGMFFDAFVPLVGLGLHSLYERIFGMHGAARRQNGGSIVAA